ncbi:hypothetical protein LJC58_00135 [Lachnospiraceae bacterium OttesenSCG-928-D06]|nr:hypothetical protein [Lachnospiraceae bacterium OttesenSCG-928-D06]
MKIIKGISLFFIYPVIMLLIGFLGGVTFMNFFYPGKFMEKSINSVQEEEVLQDWQQAALENVSAIEAEFSKQTQEPTESLDEEPEIVEEIEEDETVEVGSNMDMITVDTEYILEETDVVNQSIVENVSKVPAKYLGMDRNQFLDAMSAYESSPPLSELEKGFVGLEVLSFSSQRVVVQMNYEYKTPISGFYLLVEDNYVVVYLDDKETVYMHTDIHLFDLPEEVQQSIIDALYMEDEERLFNFLEAYSS